MNTTINLKAKFELFSEHWSPKVIAEMNDYQFKLVKIKGQFTRHDHNDTDEVFKGRYWDRFYHHDNKSIISGYRIKYKSDEIIFRVVNNIRGEAYNIAKGEDKFDKVILFCREHFEDLKSMKHILHSNDDYEVVYIHVGEMLFTDLKELSNFLDDNKIISSCSIRNLNHHNFIYSPMLNIIWFYFNFFLNDNWCHSWSCSGIFWR